MILISMLLTVAMIGPLKWIPPAMANLLIYEDCAQTLYFTSQGVPEMNPILGRHPSKLKVETGCVLSMAINTYPSKWRKYINAITIGVETYVVLSDLKVPKADGSVLNVGIRLGW